MIPTEPVLNGEDLFTISAGGYSATADAFARDPDTGGLWFLSMVGPQTALKAIWASLLKQPPDTAHLIKGVEGMALSGGYQQCQVPYHTVGTWTTRIARLPASRGWHALVYTRPRGAQFRAGRLPAPGPGPSRCPWSAPPLPGPAQPPAPGPLLAGLALASGLGHRRDRAPGVRRAAGLQLPPQR